MCVCVDDDHTVSSDTFPSLAHLFLWWRIVFFGVGLVNKKKYIYIKISGRWIHAAGWTMMTRNRQKYFFFLFFPKKEIFDDCCTCSYEN
jgi:hypothetical protein